MPAQILLITEVFPPQKGGSGRWLWELYRRLEGVGVTVAASDAVEGTAAFDTAAPMPIERLPLKFSTWGLASPSGVRQHLRAFARLNAVAARTGATAVHAAKCLPEGLLGVAIKVRRRIPLVCFAHGEELTLAHTSRELKKLTAFVLKRADLIVANSHFTERVLLDDWRVPAARVAVMHPGVDTTRFVPAPRSDAVRAGLGWTGRRVILTVGALQERKGQDMLIRALPAIRAAVPNVLYAMAGEGWKRAYLEQLIAEYGVGDVVQFRGIPGEDELVRCYQQCDIFAMPNRRIGWDVEGFGIVFLEAQACGRPVLAGNSGGTADTLQPGVTGELVSSDSPDPVADAAIRLLTDEALAAEMGAAARTWVASRFDWQPLARQAESLFRRMAQP